MVKNQLWEEDKNDKGIHNRKSSGSTSKFGGDSAKVISNDIEMDEEENDLF